MVGVFKELKRVLRSDGTFWLNLGDSFSSTDGCYGRSDPKSQKSNAYKSGQYYWTGRIKATSGLPSKNLVMVPFRLALALQADGWIVRQDIIWNKTSALPEPTKDRPSSIHEHIFLLAKSQHYYYDKKATGELNSFNLLGNGTKYQNSVWTFPSGSSGINFCKGCYRIYHPEEYGDWHHRIRLEGSLVGKQRHFQDGSRGGASAEWPSTQEYVHSVAEPNGKPTPLHIRRS